MRGKGLAASTERDLISLGALTERVLLVLMRGSPVFAFGVQCSCISRGCNTSYPHESGVRKSSEQTSRARYLRRGLRNKGFDSVTA